MIWHWIWLKSHSPNNDKQAVLTPWTKEGNRHAQPLNEVVKKFMEDIIKLFLNSNKPKRIQNTRQSPSPKESGTNTNKSTRKVHLRTLRNRVTLPPPHHPISSALCYALIRSDKCYISGDWREYSIWHNGIFCCLWFAQKRKSVSGYMSRGKALNHPICVPGMV